MASYLAQYLDNTMLDLTCMCVDKYVQTGLDFPA